ncbi:MAG: 23S rRNA (cytidine(2498)-2'-O)-methyltransferase RlmM [Xanthomonadales bacterium]|nr:Ribosomal RNA large subunit methyltransferase M [Xanthomonadales bacterium]MCC6593201.1 23S rRNA (cytidine(2498)-2'-O)-methyltransferase RlmM [Xanthomonadales bacterium]MCE7930699.1 23S rRNA (cytidine(2498)-2'-O)-methyltransferase RlmM [Xanthomonadales bacterium PRO6]
MTRMHLALLCRAGFEPDLIAELRALPGLDAAGVASPQAALVRVQAAARAPQLDELLFARELMVVAAELVALEPRDRVTPLAAALAPFARVQVVVPDSDDTRPLAPLASALEARLRAHASVACTTTAAVWLLTSTHALVGQVPPGGAAFPGGIPRLRFPRGAPSRSTLKLEEAFHVLLDERERGALLRAGGNAVDLGAAPGGWTFQLVQRGLRVTAIDNGRIDASLLASGQVRHLREDGFRYRPPKPVDWLVCDMVEKPDRVAELVLRWATQGWCRAAIFNLKLPMKRRFDAWQRARATLSPLLARGWRLRARQLYHDREEVTVALLPVDLRAGAGATASNDRSQHPPASRRLPEKSAAAGKSACDQKRRSSRGPRIR